MARRDDLSTVSVTGADELLRVSKALKAAGQTEVRKDLNKALRNAAKPLIGVVKDAARSELPSRGGAGDFFAGKRTRIQVKTGRTAGVSVVIAKQDPRLDSEGRLAHPVFGRVAADGKRVVVVQRVRKGIFTRALDFSAPDVRDELLRVLDETAQRIAREAS